MTVRHGRGARISSAVLRRFACQARDERGNLAMILALLLIPLLAFIAFAIDYGRGQSLHDRMQRAADAAVTAAMRKASLTDAELTRLAYSYFAANGGGQGLTEDGVTFSVQRSADGVAITARGKVATSFARVFTMDDLAVTVTNEAKSGAGDMEIALVLDNTGSMRGNMGDLKRGARDLVELLFDQTVRAGSLKMAVVPYVGAVNIGNDAAHMAWMDTTADSSTHARQLEGMWIAREDSVECDPANWNVPGGGGGGGGGPGGGMGGSDRSELLPDVLSTFASLAGAIVGLRPAQAAAPATAPPGYTKGGYTSRLDGRPCFLISPNKINYFDLYPQIPGGAWKGCVEARPEPFDVDDTAPTAADPDTLFVPYFWPDEADQASGSYSVFPNDYQADGAYPAGFMEDWEFDRTFNIWKYDGAANTIADVPPLTKGPNQACPDPILPLTDSRADILDTIDTLSEWEGSGTVSSEGVAWGWRVLSPGEPFTEGRPYGDTTKVIVLMTDGMNMAAEQASSATYTDYTAYGYLQYGRIPTVTYQGYHDYLNDRMLEACANAKAMGVKIYTITFGALDPDTRNLYETCATAPPYHYDASTAGQLVEAFQRIGGEISALRLSK